MSKKSLEISKLYAYRMNSRLNQMAAKSAREVQLIFRRIEMMKGMDNNTDFTIIDMFFLI
ncbi:MAG: hypothetical protein IE880_08995 [Epsilonproteobacteria bacterium]|nr:hypothetical protein [Campylobacterota bacterium]